MRMMESPEPGYVEADKTTGGTIGGVRLVK